MPVSNPSALWLGGISLGYGVFTLVRTPSSGELILALCAFGTMMIVLGADARRLWSVWEAGKLGLVVGGVFAAAAFAVNGKPLPALVAVVGCPAIAIALAAVIGWFDRRLVARMIRAHRAAEPIERFAVAAVKTSRRVVFEVAFLLVEWQRFALLEQLATHSFVPHADSLRRFYLALALHARGRYREAMDLAKTTNQLDQGPFVREQWEQLVAKIQIASGEADVVVASFSLHCTVDHPAYSPYGQRLAIERKLVLADAHVVSGDQDTARRLVEAVAVQHGRGLLERLQSSTRPVAIVAAKLVTAPDSPYR